MKLFELSKFKLKYIILNHATLVCTRDYFYNVSYNYSFQMIMNAFFSCVVKTWFSFNHTPSLYGTYFIIHSAKQISVAQTLIFLHCNAIIELSLKLCFIAIKFNCQKKIFNNNLIQVKQFSTSNCNSISRVRTQEFFGKNQ